ncbi:MAG: hypothetical protein HY290_08675 [Planctomycetia bacterium]|nr:hypothetical protein [Planctomycetia bacterium]
MVFVDSPFGWHAPVDWKVPAALLGGVAVHSVCSLVACLVARRHGCRVWIDSGLHRSRRQKIWPPKCAGQSNEAGAVWLPIGTATFIILFLGIDTLAQVAYGMEIPAGFLIVAASAGGVLFSRSVRASTPEACWYGRKPV